MRIVPLTNGTLEPIDLTDLSSLKNFCRIGTGDIEDADLIEQYRSARRQCENFGRISISPREWKLTVKAPCTRSILEKVDLIDPDRVAQGIYLPRRPFRSLTSVEFVATDGSRSTDFAEYTVMEDRPSLIWNGAVNWGTSLRFIEVVYVAGFPPVGDPDPTHCDADYDVAQAVKEQTSYTYHNRFDEKERMGLSNTARQLLLGYRRPAGYSA